MRILVLNAGSSSLKASVLEPPGEDPLLRAGAEWGSDATRAADRTGDIAALLVRLSDGGVPLRSIEAVGHRVVHGGMRFTAPARIVREVLAGIEALRELAPLHNRIAAETIEAALVALPGVPQVAVFDTAFHAGLAPAAHVYPLPWAWYADWGIRRFGFHGLAVAWAVERAAELLGRPAGGLGLVVAHLGSGCSVTATWGARSLDTSMGLTPLEGLMMGTRAGSIDPGILLAVLRDGRLDLDGLADALDHRSGLLGVSGRSADTRELLPAAAAGDERAVLALDMFARRAAAGIAAVATSLPRLDGLVFSGGIGEHAGPVRAAIVARLGPLGIAPVPAREVEADAVLSRPGAAVAVLRIEAREDVVVARQVETLLARP